MSLKPLSAVLGVFDTVAKGVFAWKQGEDKITISKMEFDQLRLQMTQQFQLKLMEEAEKPTSNFRAFMLDYEGRAADQTPFIKNLRASIRPLLTIWATIIITALIFGWVDASEVKANLAAVPTMLWAIFMAVFTFWFGERAVGNVLDRHHQGKLKREQSTPKVADSQVSMKW